MVNDPHLLKVPSEIIGYTFKIYDKFKKLKWNQLIINYGILRSGTEKLRSQPLQASAYSADELMIDVKLRPLRKKLKI
jgi:hypothetical protein